MRCSLKILQCYLQIIPTEPIALIMGGSKIRIPADRDLYVNGTDSVNVDCAEGDGCYLSYEWKCSGIKFCNGFSSDDGGFIIPKNELSSEVKSFVLKKTVYLHLLQ